MNWCAAASISPERQQPDGGVSSDLHPATGLLTVFVYDGNEGGAGFAERGFTVAEAWLRATAEAILSCECQAGCPSCVQSPKCGTGNEPLAKEDAVLLLETLLGGAPGPPGASAPPVRSAARSPAKPPSPSRAHRQSREPQRPAAISRRSALKVLQTKDPA